MLAGRTVTDLDASVLAALATLDGAMVCDRQASCWRPVRSCGIRCRRSMATGAAEGARTTAAMAASRFGPVLKVSEDGLITCFDSGRVWDI